MESVLGRGNRDHQSSRRLWELIIEIIVIPNHKPPSHRHTDLKIHTDQALVGRAVSPQPPSYLGVYLGTAAGSDSGRVTQARTRPRYSHRSSDIRLHSMIWGNPGCRPLSKIGRCRHGCRSRSRWRNLIPTRDWLGCTDGASAGTVVVGGGGNRDPSWSLGRSCIGLVFWKGDLQTSTWEIA